MTTDIQAIIFQMTLEEKAALYTVASAWTTTPVQRLGIPEMIVSDAPMAFAAARIFSLLFFRF